MKRLILTLLTGAALAASSPAHADVKTIVLVHGAFADGSGWKPVADILQSHGYSVLVVQEPETSLAADVAAARRILDKAGPCMLVGASTGKCRATSPTACRAPPSAMRASRAMLRHAAAESLVTS